MKNVKLCFRLLFFLAFIPALSIGAERGELSLSGAPGWLPESVGELGDVDRLDINGVKTFPVQDIREGLRSNPDFLLLSHPSASFAEYLNGLQRMIVAGYEALGFPDSHVSVTYNRVGGKVGILVDEGPRFMAGDIQIIGAKTINVPQLIRHLTEPFPPPDAIGLKTANTPGSNAAQKMEIALDGPEAKRATRLNGSGREIEAQPPAWERGKPASFHSTEIVSLTSALTNGLAQLGYLFPKVNVTVLPDPRSQTAICKAQILDEGPQDTVDAIEVEGNKVNSREAIIRLAGLQRGARLDQNVISDAELLLWSSGRFLTQSVIPERIGTNGSRIKLRITVLEQDDVPPLSSELSKEEKALLRLRDWLARFKERDEDLVIEFTGVKSRWAPELDLEMIVAPKRGVALTAEESHQTADPHSKYSIVLSDRRIEWSSSLGTTKLLLTNAFQVQFTAFCQTTTNLDNPSEAGFGAGFRVGSELAKNDQQTVKMELLFAPAAFVRMAHGTNRSCQIKGTQLIIRNAGTNSEPLILEADATSGRWLRFETGDPIHGSQIRIHFEKRAFQKRLDQLATSTAGRPNAFLPEQPVSSGIGSLAGEIFQSHWFQQLSSQKLPQETWTRVAAASMRIMNRETLGPLDAIFSGAFKPAQDQFYIPSEAPVDLEQARKSLLASEAALAFGYFDEFFPKQSWPSTVAREVVCVLKGQPKYTDSELQRVYNSEIGPIGCLTIAKLLAQVKSPMARTFATHGLVRLTLEDFQKDYRIFFGGDLPLAKAIRNTATALGKLEPGQVDELASVLPPDVAQFIKTVAQRIRQNGNADEALAGATDDYWEHSLMDQVRHALMTATRPTP